MDSTLFNSLQWRLVGPHRGGRVVAVAGHPKDVGTFYFGACAGGIWKTTSGGALWENISDGYLNTAAIGALAVADSDPNVIYAGTGEATIRSNISHGDGVYRSTDGGRSWRNIGLRDTRHISDLVIHPTNPDIAYVAALGHAWGRNEQRGVYRTRNGGDSWEQVLYKSDRAGAADIAMETANPRILFATIWQAQRYPHALQSGGEDSGLWRSTDGGDTWTDITRNTGLPTGTLGKIGVAVSPARPGRVWALVEAEDGALFRSDDYGDTWERLAAEPDLRRRPWYYMHVFADPQDAETLWVLNLDCWRSTDGGRTFSAVPTPHGDNHALWIDPRNPNRMIEGNDGGACVSYDGGRAWSSILNQPTAQFYHVTVDSQTPYHLYGSQQDNWAMRVPSIDFEGAISWKDYTEPGGGESGHIAIAPRPPHLVYGGGIGTGAGHGRLIAWNPKTGHKRNITVWPEVVGSGAGAEALKYRFQWTFPIEVSPHSEDTLYITSNFVHRSRDEGTTWETISPDLTRNEPERLKSSGGAITADNSGAEIYCTIFAFRESPHEPGTFWAGTDDGLVHISRDAGQSWQHVTPSGLPAWATVQTIEPSPDDPATAYLAATAYKLDDVRPYLFKTNDYGATWTPIVEGLPDEAICRVIREDPECHGLLYCGTETGVYVSFDDGARWQPFQANLPVVPIYDLVVKDNDLVAATHGRAFWILDDVSPLRQLCRGGRPSTTQLFAPRPVTRFRQMNRPSTAKTPGYVAYKMTGPVTVAFRQTETEMGTKGEVFLDAGSNPPDGAIVHYVLPAGVTDDVTLEFLDADGNVVREFSSASETPPRVPKSPGANRFVWNLRYARATKLAQPKTGDRFADTAEEGLGPKALPGEYRVRLTVGTDTLAEPLRIVPDPRLSVTAEDIRAQFELKLKIRDRVSELHELLNTLRAMRAQLDAWDARGLENQDIHQGSERVRAEIGRLEGRLILADPTPAQPGPNRLKEKFMALSGMIDEADAKPTAGSYEVYELLAAQLDDVRHEFEQLRAGEVAALEQLLRASGAPLLGA